MLIFFHVHVQINLLQIFLFFNLNFIRIFLQHNIQCNKYYAIMKLDELFNYQEKIADEMIFVNS